MKNIKNIIFDLGGVFIEIDYYKTEKAFVDLGIKNFNQLYNQHHATPLFEQLETGKISATGFYEAFRLTAKCNLTDKQIEGAWNTMLGKFYVEHITWLQQIRQQYNVYLFSNTNVIHYDAFQKIYSNQTGKKSFDDYFIKAWYSHDVKLRKPYPEAFEAIIQNQNLLPAETLFIDDSVKNIIGAQSVGLQTIHLEHAEDLIKIIIN